MNIHTGDILSVTRGILVQGCNCQGVMGSGLAKHIKDKYPSVAARYVSRNRAVGLLLGDVQFIWNRELANAHPKLSRALLSEHDQSPELPPSLVIANGMTQEFYGREPGRVYVSYPAVFSVFSRVRLLALATGLPVVFPLIGAGLAKGDWHRIQGAIEAGLREQMATAQLWLQPGARLPD